MARPRALAPLKNFLAIRHGSSRVHGTLGAFVNSNQIQPLEVLFPAYTVQLIELGLRWNPEARSSMKKMEEPVFDNFKFTELQDCQSANVSAQPGCQPVKEEAMSSTGDRSSQGNGTVEGRRKRSMSALEHKRVAETQTGGEIKKEQTRIVSTGRVKCQGIPMCLLRQLWIAAVWSQTEPAAAS